MKLSFKGIFSCELLRFLLIGGTATSIDLILYLLLGLWISVSLSKFLSMSCSCVFSFFMNRRWTFRNKEKITVWQVSKYVTVQLVNIGVNIGVNALVLYSLKAPKLVAFMVATGTAMVVNFLLQKFLVFRTKPGGDQEIGI